MVERKYLERFIGAFIVNGHAVKVVRRGVSLTDKVRCYIDGEVLGDFLSQREAKAQGTAAAQKMPEVTR